MSTTRQYFAEAIMNMNYGTLCAIAKEFSEMIDADVRPKIETPQEFAELLFDWAEAQETGLHL